LKNNKGAIVGAAFSARFTVSEASRGGGPAIMAKLELIRLTSLESDTVPS
jgi:hypothetical protein